MDFAKITVGYDGGAEANDALALARDLAGPSATLTLAEVFDPGLLTGRPSLYVPEVRARTGELSHRAERVLCGRPFEPLVVAGAAARQLNRVAHTREVDLVVVGSTHRGPIGRVLAGTVADRLMNGAPCAVAVAPRGYAHRGDHGDGPVVVGYNGTEESDVALETGARLAAALDATLRLVCGMHEPESGFGRGPYLPEMRSRLRAQLGRVEAECPPEINVETALLEGEPAEVLLRQADEARLLVVGSRGYGPLRRVLLGSVSSAIVARAACPVIVVPRGGGEEAGGDELSRGEASRVRASQPT